MLEWYKVDAGKEIQSFLADFKRICADQKIPMMLGNMSSKTLFAIYETAKSCNMSVLAATSGANWVYPDNGKWIFRYLPVPELVLPVPELVLPVLYKKLKDKLGAKTVALSFTIDDDFTFFNAKLARKHIEANGMKIVADLGTKLKEINYASPVAAVRASKADLVVLSHQPDDGGKFALQMRERGIKTQISDTGYTVVGRDYWVLSNGTGIGSIGSSLYTSSDKRPIVQDWIKRWRERSGKADQDPDPYETSTYDSVKMIARILDNAKSLSRQDIADAFMTIQNVESISGTISYRESDLPDIYRSEPVLVQLGDNGALNRWGN